jgi:alpha-glucosidase (family GH31 glycosyl hydrolase)
VQTAKKDEFMGLYFRNSNAMSPVLYYTGESTSTLSFIATGGQLEVYFLFKGTPKQIIKQYQNIVGKPHLPPFWSLGWHASSSAYTNLTELANNVDEYAKAGIPLEGVWLDYPWQSS